MIRAEQRGRGLDREAFSIFHRSTISDKVINLSGPCCGDACKHSTRVLLSSAGRTTKHFVHQKQIPLCCDELCSEDDRPSSRNLVSVLVVFKTVTEQRRGLSMMKDFVLPMRRSLSR